ncbi:MAG: beta-N-acetylhexosaminidase [Rhodobacteraceae bacterium]|nr:beta-N-acetylhexosaminidase [Paracoccaceae bacterium]
MVKSFITGCSGTSLSQAELNFLKQEDPWGLILFRRNCESAAQVRDLVSSFRDAVGRDNAPVLIDQEGGRVQRLQPPIWHKYPAAQKFGDLYRIDRERGRQAAWLTARLIAYDLKELGITVDCLPLLDAGRPETSDVIGDRAYCENIDAVTDLGRQTAGGLMTGGVLPVMKHIPGHGRAVVDSHLELPVVDTSLEELDGHDFVPFKKLKSLPLAMTAHILFPQIDARQPVTQSKYIIENVIRGRIGFSGCLMSDDISMKALGGSIKERCQASFSAGCDLVLHCNGDLAEMQEVAASSPNLSGTAQLRCNNALSLLKSSITGFDVDAGRAKLCALLGD